MTGSVTKAMLIQFIDGKCHISRDLLLMPSGWTHTDQCLWIKQFQETVCVRHFAQFNK